MNKQQALTLKPGDRLLCTHTRSEVTVLEVIPTPTAEQPKGSFPLVLTKEEGVLTYKLLSKRSPAADDLTAEEINLLSWLFAKWGNRTKSKIRDAWQTGNYDGLTVKPGDECILQTLRNVRGSAWLERCPLSRLA